MTRSVQLSSRLGLSCLVVLGLLASQRSAAAAELRVPSHFATIQSAIDAARAGDVVIVAPGRYVENLDFRGKAIHVAAPEGATIDGGGTAPCVRFGTGEGPLSILEGFTIENGLGAPVIPGGAGGGVLCVGTSPTIRGNTIRGCDAGSGAGIAAVIGGSPRIERNIVMNNGTSGTTSGGGIYLEGPSSPSIVDNLVEGNLATSIGGGLAALDATVKIVDNTFRENHIVSTTVPFGNGGAIGIDGGGALLERNRIERNEADGFGGGLFGIETEMYSGDNQYIGNRAGVGGAMNCDRDSGLTITGDSFTENYAYGGGAVAASNARRVDADNARFSDNVATLGSGGAIALSTVRDVTLQACRFQRNRAGGGGGAIHVDRPERLRIATCEIQENEARDGGGIYIIRQSETTTIENCSVTRNRADFYGGGICFEYRAGGHLRSCTVVDNEASRGTAVSFSNNGQQPAILENSIVWQHEFDPASLISDRQGTAIVSDSIVRGGWAGPGNLALDPRFVDPARGDYRLRYGSPAIDRLVPAPGDFESRDFEGEPRVSDGDFDGVLELDLGADEMYPSVASRFGSVGDGVEGAPLSDVLFLNGSAGDRNREIAVAVRDPLKLEMFASPAGPTPGRFVLYAYESAPDPITVTPQRFGLGLATFPTPLDRRLPQQVRFVWNNVGFPHRLGTASAPSTPAPSTVFDLATGVSVGMEITFQGLIEDSASSAEAPFSLTNAIVLRVAP